MWIINKLFMKVHLLMNISFYKGVKKYSIYCHGIPYFLVHKINLYGLGLNKECSSFCWCRVIFHRGDMDGALLWTSQALRFLLLNLWLLQFIQLENKSTYFFNYRAPVLIHNPYLIDPPPTPSICASVTNLRAEPCCKKGRKQQQ